MKDIAASILARLKNQAKETGLSYQMCLQLFCQEEFLRRLSLSQYNSNFVLKGGLFIYTLTEFQSRATQDVDFLMRQLSNDIDKVKGVIEDISRVPTANDYITIEVLNAEMITPDKEYQGALFVDVKDPLLFHVLLPMKAAVQYSIYCVSVAKQLRNIKNQQYMNLRSRTYFERRNLFMLVPENWNAIKFSQTEFQKYRMSSSSALSIMDFSFYLETPEKQPIGF